MKKQQIISIGGRVLLMLCISKLAHSLPLYTALDVAYHKNHEVGIWVTYQGNVYDVSEFVRSHPGGEKILLAAGGPLEPHWKFYPIHQAQHVQALLNQFKIGALKEPLSNDTMDISDAYADEPLRDSSLHVLSRKPLNAETPAHLLRSFITPLSYFYKRNHFPVPKVDLASYQLEVWREKELLATYTLQDLKKKFQSHEIVATLQCGGNRRSEMSNIKSVKGLSWSQGAIGNAHWKGVYLADLLKKHVKSSDQFSHIQFEGLDGYAGDNYGASIPFHMGTRIEKQVLLAYKMNDKNLSAEHGFPLRVVVPGVVGARSVKWLKKIVVSQYESSSFWQQQDYKIYGNESISELSIKHDISAIQEMPVQSAIILPVQNAKLSKDQDLMIEGYAWSGGGRAIDRVEISLDGGVHWQVANLQTPIEQSDHQAWAWIPWQLKISRRHLKRGKMEIISNAIDIDQNFQPERIESIWNVRGLNNNAWYRVTISIF